MTKATAVVILILFSTSGVHHVDSLMQESLGKFLGSFAAFKQVRIPDLLNQLCNSSQGSNTTRRDACYGCFYRASILPQGYAMLIAMSTCADSYLNNTSYGHCQSYLRNATTMPNVRVSPTIIYCTFLECVRQVNKDSLLRECVREAMRMIPMFNSTERQLTQLFVNTTACVLAKTRCSYTNPVTGALQDDDIVNKLHLPTMNAILVNTEYDINIVQLPFRHSNVDVCSKYRNVQQATWPSVVC
ncbi:uncharacterized protein LOC105186907 isoform X2 [Harpegnathos saltator]|uniref:uncharacterized protein LOC105186907 isoform X2 n=1 Tax=Harpegnathos saltator TaxID=610380 RepID=UPI000948ACB1|nr:uncharacterized protein LOC105186907 isoform X2 [Harpegnathos saltator]